MRTRMPALVALLTVFSFYMLCQVSPDYSPDVVDLHKTLTEFTTRGQSTVELFAPLSIVVGRSSSWTFFVYTAGRVAWALVAVLFTSIISTTRSLVQEKPTSAAIICAVAATVGSLSCSKGDGGLIYIVSVKIPASPANSYLSLAKLVKPSVRRLSGHGGYPSNNSPRLATMVPCLDVLGAWRSYVLNRSPIRIQQSRLHRRIFFAARLPS